MVANKQRFFMREYYHAAASRAILRWVRALVGELDAEDASGIGIRDDVEVAVRSLAYVADALAKTREERFLFRDLGSLENDSAQVLAGERTHEEIAFPFRN